MDNEISAVMTATMSKIKEMVDNNTVVGDPITTPDGTVLIPVSKVSYGFAAGGSDIPSKSSAGLFGGGSGAGINVTPVAFIVVSGGEVRLLHIVSKPDSTDKVVNLVPDLVDKITSLFTKKKEKTETTVEAQDKSGAESVTVNETTIKE